jgi:glycosyltransferase involved in cell wall biosynthesis
MKILIISTNSDEAGAPRHVEAIVNGLSSNYEFLLIFGESGPVSARLRDNGFKVFVVKEMRTAINPIKDLISLYKIIKIIITYRPDLIHCHSSKAGMLGRMAAIILRKKWLYTVHGWGWRGQGWVKEKIIIAIEKVLSFIPGGRYIYVANDVENAAINILGINKCQGSVIYNGVAPINTNSDRESKDLVIMMPARVSSAKDHDSLLLAFEKYKNNNKKLVLCGSGTDFPEFILKAKILAPNSIDKIKFLGEQSNISQIYSQSDVVALISHFEALPLSIIEAMSCGKAIIGTNVGGISELIDNQSSGLIVKPECVNSIVDALNIYSDKQKRIDHGNMGFIKYQNKFTDKTMFESTSLVYQKLSGA